MPSILRRTPISKAQMANYEKAAMKANSSSLAPPDIPCSQCYGITNEVALEVYKCSDGSGPYYYHNAVLNGGPIPASIIGQYVRALPIQPCTTALTWGVIWRVDAILPAFGGQQNTCTDLEITNCGTSIPDSYNCSGLLSDLDPPLTPTTTWTCYDPGTGLGQYGGPTGYIDCVTNCQAPIPITYNCSGASGVGHPSGLQWQCYDPGTGLGQYMTATQCAVNCNAPLDTYNCSGPPNWNCYIPSIGVGQFTGPTAQADCQTVCVEPLIPPSWNCHIPFGATIGTCTDPGTGLGQYSAANNYLNPYQDCVDACKDLPYIPIETGEDVSWNCTWKKVWGIWNGSCSSVYGTGGQHLTELLCLAACQEHPFIPSETGGISGGTPCELCCCASYQTGPGLPWICIPGTQVMSAANLNPCDCAELGPNMIDCIEDVGPPVYGYNCNNVGACIGPIANGTYTGANAALNLNPATPGINYPNSLAGALAYCEDSCLPVIGVLCDRILSCPCGWLGTGTLSPYSQTTIECSFTSSVGQSMTIPAIENCMEFINPPHQPVVGEVWAHSSPVQYQPPFTWDAAYVVLITGSLSGMPSTETRSTCN